MGAQLGCSQRGWQALTPGWASPGKGWGQRAGGALHLAEVIPVLRVLLRGLSSPNLPR